MGYNDKMFYARVSAWLRLPILRFAINGISFLVFARRVFAAHNPNSRMGNVGIQQAISSLQFKARVPRLDHQTSC